MRDQELYKNKYRTLSNRLAGWNYSKDAIYHITMVTYMRKNIFENDENEINDFGIICNQQLMKSFQIRKELHLHEYAIMSNHIHILVEIKNNQQKNMNDSVEIHGRGSLHNFPDGYLQHSNRGSLRKTINKNNGIVHKRKLPSRPKKSISSFVAGFKTKTLIEINNMIRSKNDKQEVFSKLNPLWQRSYYDVIMRNEIQYLNTIDYIKNHHKN